MTARVIHRLCRLALTFPARSPIPATVKPRKAAPESPPQPAKKSASRQPRAPEPRAQSVTVGPQAAPNPGALRAQSVATYPDLEVLPHEALALDPGALGSFDLVLVVGNVMVYLGEGTERRVLTRVRDLLAPGVDHRQQVARPEPERRPAALGDLDRRAQSPAPIRAPA